MLCKNCFPAENFVLNMGSNDCDAIHPAIDSHCSGVYRLLLWSAQELVLVDGYRHFFANHEYNIQNLSFRMCLIIFLKRYKSFRVPFAKKYF